MSPAQLLPVIAALGGALLLSEFFLASVGLHRARIGFGTWSAGVVALAVAAHWADGHTPVPDSTVHCLVLAAASLLTCLWFNDHAPVKAKAARRAPGATASARSTVRG